MVASRSRCSQGADWSWSSRGRRSRGPGRAAGCRTGHDASITGSGLFGFVAAVDVVAAQFDVRAAAGVVALLGAVAVAAWALLVIHVAGLVHSGGLATIRAGARGSRLLVVVATQSLVLIAARLAVVVGPAAGALLVASVVGWVTGVLAYLVIALLVVARMLAARMAPALLTPGHVGADGCGGDRGRRGRGRAGRHARRRSRDRRARGGGRLLGGRDGLDPGAGRRGMAQGPRPAAPLRARAVVDGVPAGHVRRRLRDGGGHDVLRRACGRASAALYWVALAAWCLTTVGHFRMS